MACRVCGGDVTLWGHQVVLEQYRATYDCCTQCRFVQVANPYWLAEAYKSPITHSDVGLVDRNLRASRVAGAVVRYLFSSKGKYLDFGGGTGLFTRLMRDRGYNFFWKDAYCNNLFARGFSATDQDHFDLVTAMEVFEHLLDPVAVIQEMLSQAEAILFTTLLVSDPPPHPGDWWYYGAEHGQHVSFFSRKALEVVANRFQLYLSTDGHSVHLLSKYRIPEWIFRLMIGPVGIAVEGIGRSKRSLLMADFEKVFKGSTNADRT